MIMIQVYCLPRKARKVELHNSALQALRANVKLPFFR
jgi:hypothetical protein